MTHPYFVCIKDLILPKENPVLINPAEDEIRQSFAEVRQLMLPFQSVSLIEEYSADPDAGKEEKAIVKGEVVVNKRFIRKPE